MRNQPLIKVAVGNHVLESVEKTICRTHLLLSRFGDRCSSMVTNISEMEIEQQRVFSEAAELLGEMGGVFAFMAESLEHTETNLSDIRRKAIEEIKQESKRLRRIA